MGFFRRALVASAALFLSPAFAGTIQIVDDGTFSDSVWRYGIYDLGDATSSAFSDPTVGQLAPSLRFQGDLAYGSDTATQGRLNLLYEAFTYDPSVHGAIQNISFSVDAINYLPDPNAFSQPFVRLSVVQDWNSVPGALFYGQDMRITSSWDTYNQFGLTASDFSVQPGTHPDFSANGSPIRFVFDGWSSYYSQALGNQPMPFDLGFDNLSITITTVPPPAAVWLFGSALGLLGWMRRKRTVRQVNVVT